MNELLDRAFEAPVTYLVAVAYLTLAFFTDPFNPTPEALVAYGALRSIDAWDGESWRLLSYAFLHGGIIHLLVNLMSLMQIGPVVERSMGSVRFAVLYIVTAIGGGIFGCLFNHPLAPMVGGSGALFGMMGALLALIARGGRHAGDFFGNHAARSLMGNIGVNLVLGWLIPFVSNAGHIGGLITGGLLTSCFFVAGRSAPTATLRTVQATACALFLAGLASALLPVTRFDYLLLQWDRCEKGPRRDELRAAFWRAFLITQPAQTPASFDATVGDDDATAGVVDELKKARSFKD